MVNVISLNALHFYLWLTAPYPSYNYTQRTLCPVVVGTAQQRKQMTNLTAIYTQAHRGLTMGCVSRWFVWILGTVAIANL